MTCPPCSARPRRARPVTRTGIWSTSRRSAIRPLVCRSAKRGSISRLPSPVRPTSTPTCTRAWPRRRARRASARSPTGSRHWRRPSARTPIASRRPWTASEPASARLCDRGAHPRPERPRARRRAWAAPAMSDTAAPPPPAAQREGSLEAPKRAPLEWRSDAFYDRHALEQELERVFDICHGCRRCFSLCNAFPTLFDAVDATSEGEVAAVDRKVFWEVVDHCYLCDMCFMTKCPYVPPHPWNVDFPHLMLRAKAVKNRSGGTRWRDKILSSTDTVGRLAGIPVVAEAVNAVNRSSVGRKVLEAALGVHPEAPVPPYRSSTLRKQLAKRVKPALAAQAAGVTRGKVALFATCYGNRNEPEIGLDLIRVFEHNGIEVALVEQESCCGMPKLELGDLEAVADLKAKNVPRLIAM